MHDTVQEGVLEKVPVCALGASAGGLAALRTFFQNVPDDLGLAYVVITHLAPDHPSVLSDILGGCTSMPVQQVLSDLELLPDTVYVIPPDRELVIDGNNITARPFTEPRGQRAPIDMFFRSVAAGRGDGCAIVLSGAGSDGAKGVEAIRAQGGVVFVQDPKDAEYAMMPRNAIASGAADFVEAIPQMVDRLVEVVHSKSALRSMQGADAQQALQRVLAFLHARTGHDFSKYKRATVLRRIYRRMQVARLQNLGSYCDYLTGNPEEAQELLGDILISVTSFFRDPEAYAALAKSAIPSLFENTTEEGIRIWVAGCATGEEAYSLAILLLEEAERRQVSVPIQIFATDLDEGALSTAREGRYGVAIEADVSEERLARFFVREGAHYRIRREARDTVLFASHSVLKDPPFLRLDMIACRNLLIYLDSDLQRELCTMYGYALKPNGVLFLGSAETPDAAPDSFTALDREHRIYRVTQHRLKDKPMQSKFPPKYHTTVAMPQHRPEPEDRDRRIGALHHRALEKSAPPSALVDRDFRVVHLSENAGRYLLPAAGPYTADFASLVRPELRIDVSTGLRRALEQGATTLSPAIAVGFNGSRHKVMMRISPVSENAGNPASQALVLFIDAGPAPSADDITPEQSSADDIRHLRGELNAARAQLVASRVEYETAIQELRVANEELQSINEEYQSTSEELETSKEELQSMNEELRAVNSELKSKLESISIAHSDLENMVSSTDVGTLFLDPQLRIRMFTPDVARIFNVTSADVGRALTDFTHRLNYQGLADDAAQVLRDLSAKEQEVETQDGEWLLIRVRPYRTIDDRIEGAVVTFIDVSERRAAVINKNASEARMRALISATSNVIYSMSADWKEMNQLNGGGLLRDTTTPNREWMDDYIHENDQAQVQKQIDAAIASGANFEFEHRVRLEDGSTGWVQSRAVPIVDEHGAVTEWFGCATDVTERRRSEEARSLLIRELNHRVKNMLAVVQSIARQTRRSSATIEEFVDSFERRIRALAGAHRLLTRSEWSGSRLDELVHSSVSSFLSSKADRVHIQGPYVKLRPDASIAVAMALHELGTNALKYGSLSAAAGTLDIVWSLEQGAEGARVILNWTEREGPVVKPPKKEGFGTRLLKTGIARELDGHVDLDFPPEGLQCRLEFPLEHAAKD
ncbi:MAG: PAS domain-containing protein [Pararhodobacter sp.]|nr:PAS domain-containing protein [Pararhodobacter sp.]